MAIYDLLVQALEERPPRPEGVTLADIADLPEPLREPLQQALRAGTVSLRQIAADIGLDHKQTCHVVDLLVNGGFLSAAGESPEGESLYRVRLARRRGRDVPTNIWKSITGPPDDEKK